MREAGKTPNIVYIFTIYLILHQGGINLEYRLSKYIIEQDNFTTSHPPKILKTYLSCQNQNKAMFRLLFNVNFHLKVKVTLFITCRWRDLLLVSSEFLSPDIGYGGGN